MGNTLPITAPPKPSASRAVIFMKAEGVLQYLNKPWNPIGRLQLLNATEELPAAFDGIVTIDEYKDMISSVDERASNYRGGRIAIGVAMFQACLLVVLIIGFILSRFAPHMLGGRSFFNPITIAVLGTLEFGVLSQSTRFFQREESELVDALIELFQPWRERRVIAKMRKVHGDIDDTKKSTTCYCLIIEKLGPDIGLDDTMSISTFADFNSEISDEV